MPATYKGTYTLLLLFRLFTRKQSRNVDKCFYLFSNNACYLTMQRRPLSVQIKIKASGVGAESLRAGGPEGRRCSTRCRVNLINPVKSPPRRVSKLAEWWARAAAHAGRARERSLSQHRLLCKSMPHLAPESRNCLACLFSPPQSRHPTLIWLTSLCLLCEANKETLRYFYG